MTPKEYAGTLRIEKAKELLISERQSVSEISEQLGFADLYHFSKIFKEKTSYSPLKYRELHRR